MDSNTVAESDMSLNPDHTSTGWVIECGRYWANPQKMQHKTATNILEHGECVCLRHHKHLLSWERTFRKFMLHHNIGNNLTMKQMFDISEKLIAEPSHEIYGVKTLNWSDSTWKHFIIGWWWRSHQSLAREGLRIFRVCVLSLKDESEPTFKYCLGRQVDVVQEFTTIQNLRTQLMESQRNSSGIYFPGFTTLQHCYTVQEFLSKMSEKPVEFSGLIIFMSMFNDISWWSQDNEQECNANADFFSIFAQRFPQGRWSFLGPGSEKKWYSTSEDSPQGEWDRVADLMMIKFWESGHPVFRSTSPLSRGTLKNKFGRQLSIHFCDDEGTIVTVFRTIISAQYLRSSLRFVWWIQSLPCRNGETCIGKTMWPIDCAPKCDDNTYTFDRSSCTRRFIAKFSRTSGKALTTRSRD